jgi:tyrosyl-tRNA synthetase
MAQRRQHPLLDCSSGGHYSNSVTIDDQLAYLTKGAVDVVRRDELRKKLERSAAARTPLTVKVGFDPTAPDLHLGHTVLIRKMKHFQDLGHRVIFLIGDFTGLIGDPTGRSKTRPPLTAADIAQNAETYRAQVFKLLDPEKTIVDFNSRWLGALGSEGWIRLAARYNVAQMLERRDFRQRYEQGKPIALHEFLYPLGQGYDSVHLEADVELGGTDQLFNLNVGRDLMPGYGLEPQIVMTTPLLEGLDGVEKMSKSLNNYVGVNEAPGEMFGKLMSISDDLMWRYYLLLTDAPESDIDAMKASVASGALHPKTAKQNLAERITGDFHSRADAAEARAQFERRFSKGEIDAAAIEEIGVAVPDGGVPLTKVMADCGLAASSSDASRKIQQGAVRIDGEKIADARMRLMAGGAPVVLQVGRRAVRLVPEGR